MARTGRGFPSHQHQRQRVLATGVVTLSFTGATADIDIEGFASVLTFSGTIDLSGATADIQVEGFASAVVIGVILTGATADIQVIGFASVILLQERPVAQPRPRIYIYDAETLRRVAELTAVTSINRAYALHEHIRRAEFDIPWSHPDAELTDEADANVVYITSSECPYPWVGRIIERVYNHADRTITVHADSYEAILAERILSTDFSVPSGTGSALARILGSINGANATGIEIGHYDQLSSPPMTMANIRGIEALDKLAENAGMEWWLSYRYMAGLLHIALNMAVARGASYYDSIVLSQPGNFEVVSSRGDGRGNAYAQTVVAGQASVVEAFSERERSTAVRDSQFNRNDPATKTLIAEAKRVVRFGHVLAGETSFRAPTQRREVIAVREELKEAGITGEVSVQLLNRQRYPARSLQGRAYPDQEGQLATDWKYLEPGNVVHLVSEDAFGSGYDGPAVIVGVQPMEHQRFVDLVLELA